MFLLSMLMVACDDHKFSGGHSSEPVTGDGYVGVQAIFSTSCAGCHGGSFPPLDGDICTDVVDVSSQQASGMFMIQSGSSQDSYLYHKLVNSHTDFGGAGNQMPLGGSLSAEEIEIVAVWIDEGALCN